MRHHLPRLAREELPVSKTMQQVPGRVLHCLRSVPDEKQPVFPGTQQVVLAIVDRLARERRLTGKFRKLLRRAENDASRAVPFLYGEAASTNALQMIREHLRKPPRFFRASG